MESQHLKASRDRVGMEKILYCATLPGRQEGEES